jgi:RNA polymerase sigma factor (sigma-70 family)
MSVPDTLVLRGDEADLYRLHAHRLRGVVRGLVLASEDQLEDACASAWLILLRYQPRRETVFAWLVTVAVRELWRLRASDFEQVPLRLVDETPELAAESRDLGLALLARDRLRAVAATLPERKLRLVVLHALGYTYAEIAQLTGETPRAVDRQLSRAHRLLDPLRVPLGA